MTPTSDSETLERRLRDAFAGRAAATTIHGPRPDAITTTRIDVAVSAGRPAPSPTTKGTGADATANPDTIGLAGSPAVGGDRRRRFVAAAAVAAIGSGVLGVAHLATDTADRSDTTVQASESSSAGTAPSADSAPSAVSEGLSCGSELPFTFPAPDGYQGPLGGPGQATSQPDPSAETLELHWQAGNATIDVRWPSYSQVRSVPAASPATAIVEEVPEPTSDGRTTQQATLLAPALGTGQCMALDITVTSTDAGATNRVLDRIEIGLVGPGGVFAGPLQDLVAGSRTAHSLPDVAPCPPPEPAAPTPTTRGTQPDPVTPPPTTGGTPPDLGTYPTPQEALAFFLATEPRLAQRGYEEISLPDGTFGYTRFPTPTGDVVTAIHVVRSTEGWSVGSWASSGC